MYKTAKTLVCILHPSVLHAVSMRSKKNETFVDDSYVVKSI